MEDFQSRLKRIMKDNDLTAKDLGQKSKVGYRTIEGWLSAKKIIPRADSAVKIAQALSVSVEYLVSGNSEESYKEDNKVINPYRLKLNEILNKLPDARIIDLIRLAEGWLPTEEADKLQA